MQATNDRKNPCLNGVGERQSIAKILTRDERLEKGVEYEENTNEELKVKETKETEKLERRRQEFPLLLSCNELCLTQVVPNSKAGHVYSLLKSELVGLCSKLGLEVHCKSACKKKFSSSNRTELGDYLLSKLKDTQNIVETAQNAPVISPNVPAVVAQTVPSEAVEAEILNSTPFNSSFV